MIVPIPVLAIGALLILVLVWLAFRRRSDGRDLTGPPPMMAQPPRHRPAATPTGALPAEVEEEVRAMIAQGHKINAVKRVREATGLGLKEALDLVESL